MSSLVTWGELHAGDSVRGADQRVWEVVGVRPGATWLGSGGADVQVALRLEGRVVVVSFGITRAVELMTRGDHRDLAAACAAFISCGLAVSVLEEFISV